MKKKNNKGVLIWITGLSGSGKSLIAKKIKKKLDKKYKIDIFFSEEKKLLNTGGGIKNALKIINEKEFFVINSDIVWSEKKKSL